METYIARQPVFNKNKQIFGYEMLFRSGASASAYENVDGDVATSRVIMNSFFSKGVESITGGKPALINFTSRLLLENTATLFPKDHLIVEILEDVEPTPEIIEACQTLYDKGYKLALDDFIYRPELEPLIALSKIIKIDFLSNTPQEIAQMIKHDALKGKWLLAEKVETNEVFVSAAEMGFSLFQGYFFSKPVTMTSKMLSPHKISYISLLREVSGDFEVDFGRVSKIIRNDVALSYKLLRLVNSAFYGMRSEVTDITHALAAIGTKEFRKWTFMVALMGLSSDKPDEIIKMSMIRGRFIDELNLKYKLADSDESAFQVGLFSMLDVLMDVPLEDALEDIHLVDEVREALVYQLGPLYDLLEIAISLERSDWEQTDMLAEALNIDTAAIPVAYMDAITWCNNLGVD